MIFDISGATIEVDLLRFNDFLGKINRDSPTEKLRKVRAYLTLQGIVCSLSDAWQILTSAVKLAELWKARTVNYAEIAYWYNINPFELSEAELLGLTGNLPRVKAQERVFRREYDPANMEGVYQLFMNAFDNEDLAQDMKSHAAKLLIEQRTKTK